MQIAVAIEEPERIRIVNSGQRHLPLDEAANVRAENHRQPSVWMDLLGQARPHLIRSIFEVTVHVVPALINSIASAAENYLAKRASASICCHGDEHGIGRGRERCEELSIRIGI